MYTSLRVRLTLVLLAAAALVLYGGVWLVAHDKARDVQKVQAARKVFEAEQVLQAARGTTPWASSPDPLQGALLGPSVSPLTTDAGSLPSKITATNPNFAGAIVEMLRGAGVGPGDVVAVAYTGSFPVLDVATVISIETLGATPVIVSSVGASNWGATDPSFTILDMESILMEQGLIQHRSIASAVGGSLRRGPISDSGRDLALEAITRNGVAAIDQTGLRSGVAERWRLYTEAAGGRPLKAFVNVGGGQISIGGSTYRNRFVPGLQLPPEKQDFQGYGLLASMQEAGVPVIHLDDIITLAHQYQLPIAPSSTPAVGEGGPYRDWLLVRIAAGVAAGLLGAALLGARLLALAPGSEEQFDAYFGTAGFSLRRRLTSLMGAGRSAELQPDFSFIKIKTR